MTTLNNTGVSYWSLRDCKQALNYYYQEALITRRWIVFTLQNWLVHAFQRPDVISWRARREACATAYRILNRGSVLASSFVETILHTVVDVRGS